MADVWWDTIVSTSWLFIGSFPTGRSLHTHTHTYFWAWLIHSFSFFSLSRLWIVFPAMIVYRLGCDIKDSLHIAERASQSKKSKWEIYSWMWRRFSFRIYVCSSSPRLFNAWICTMVLGFHVVFVSQIQAFFTRRSICLLTNLGANTKLFCGWPLFQL